MTNSLKGIGRRQTRVGVAVPWRTFGEIQSNGSWASVQALGTTGFSGLGSGMS